jgi:hypothetical protein
MARDVEPPDRDGSCPIGPRSAARPDWAKVNLTAVSHVSAQSLVLPNVNGRTNPWETACPGDSKILSFLSTLESLSIRSYQLLYCTRNQRSSPKVLNRVTRGSSVISASLGFSGPNFPVPGDSGESFLANRYFFILALEPNLPADPDPSIAVGLHGCTAQQPTAARLCGPTEVSSYLFLPTHTHHGESDFTMTASSVHRPLFLPKGSPNIPGPHATARGL